MRISLRQMTPSFLAQCFQIGQIFLATDRSLVGDKMVFADEADGHVVENGQNASPFSIVPRNCSDRCDEVYADWRYSELNDLIWLDEILFRQTDRTETKVPQSCEYALGIFRVRSYEDVQIAGKAGRPMKSQGICSNDDVLNAVRVE